MMGGGPIRAFDDHENIHFDNEENIHMVALENHEEVITISAWIC